MAVIILFDFLIIQRFVISHSEFGLLNKLKHGMLTHEDSSDYRSVVKERVCGIKRCPCPPHEGKQEEQRYSSTYFYPRRYAEVSG